jgi:primary-amine oxidase
VAEDKGRRLLRALCFVRSEPTDNGFARPLDGVIAVVDMHEMKVLRIEDYGVVPLPPEPGNWARQYIEKFREAPQPLVVSQPDGASFSVEGWLVQWQNWSFRIGFTPREGLVLHQVRYRDGGEDRLVLDRASVCEMVVPYGDPGEQYYRKNAFDIGEYGIGTLANSLQLGCDCLGTIRYFDATMLDSRGKAVKIKNAICLHEEDAGLLWKHTDWRTNQSEARRSRRLSASFIATVGNYEYGFYWHLYQDGTIHCEVRLTGIMNTTALAAGKTSEFGVEVAPRLNAPFHQHIFAARLDVSLDGGRNSVYEVNTVGLPTGAQNPHGNAFRAEETLLERESAAKRSTNAATARFWRVVNPERKNRLGRPVGYRLVPGENSPVFAQSDAPILRRAGFTRHHLWVTPYEPRERYPAGDYPNQHAGGAGLPEWTAADRAVAEADVVLWYVFSHNHVPRPEDWPVMPVSAIGFHFKPDGFFARNPALDLPPS